MSNASHPLRGCPDGSLAEPGARQCAPAVDFIAHDHLEVVHSPAKPQGLTLRTPHCQPKLTDKISSSPSLHWCPWGAHPTGPGYWADFMSFPHGEPRHKYKPLKFLQKIGGRSKHFIKLELIVGLGGMSGCCHQEKC